MKTYSDNFGALEESAYKEPRFIVQISWDTDDTDYTYLTSSNNAQLPSTSPAVDSIHNSVLGISGQTQKINPNIATSTIGGVSITLSDITSSDSPPLTTQVTTRMNTKLDAGDGLRGKVIRVYVGYHDIPFTEYDLRLTYIIDSISYKDGVYTIRASDIQRESRHKIFTPHETNLDASITINDLIIPVVSIDTTLFPLLLHGLEWSVRPGEYVGYIKIEDEVICINTGVQFDTTNSWHVVAIERGALNTRAAAHDVDDDTTDNRKPKITEHIYLEGAAPKVIYSLLTGLMHGLENKLTDPFDLTTWAPIGAVTVISDTLTPVGWGPSYNVDDDSAGAVEGVRELITTDYTHGDIWTASYFVAKELTTLTQDTQFKFTSGAATSQTIATVDKLAGTISFVNTNLTVDRSGIIDFDADFWYVYIAAHSTTTGTTGVQLTLYAVEAVVTNVGDSTFFGAGLIKGESTGMSGIPLHWHLGINQSFARLSDFKTLGVDFWNVEDDTGRFVRIENPKAQDGKKYIEKEMLLWMGAFMPIYSTGELGIKKLAGVLSDASYQAVFDEYNIKSYSGLTHDMRSVINDIRVNWNWVDGKGEYTKENVFIDSVSISKHGSADSKIFKFKAVHTGLHTDEDLLTYFDVLRDRYSGPPLLLSLDLMPSMARMEVGDTVHVEIDQIRDFNSGGTLSRTFEIQQVTTNWLTGALNFKLFGSSLAAGALERTTLASVLLDTFYTSLGTELSTILTISAGTVTANGTLTGSATDIDAGVFYYDGDLTIGAGVTVTINENVQLRIKGAFLINGNIDGLGNGATAGAATSQFTDASTSDTVSVITPVDAAKNMSFDLGEQGYFGTTKAAASLFAGSNTLGASLVPGDVIGTSVDTGAFSTVPASLGVPTPVSPGTVDVVPFFQLKNDQQTNTLKGYPKDIRGNSGSGGTPFLRNGYTKATYAYTRYILANGGGGGDGGAGLLIIARGMSFGINGEIDLSGGNSAAGAVVTESTTTKQFYAGSGAPGAPGALLILLDGQVANPDVTASKFIAAYGDAVHAASTTPLRLVDDGTNNGVVIKLDWSFAYTITTWPHTKGVYNGPPNGAYENISKLDAAHRIQYVPPDETPELEKERVPPPTLHEKYFVQSAFIENANTPVTGDGMGQTLAVSNDRNYLVMGSWQRGANGSLQIFARNEWAYSFQQEIGSPSATGGEFVTIDDAGFNILTGQRDPFASPIIDQILWYTRSGTTWTLNQTLNITGGFSASDHSKFKASANAEWAIIGGAGYDSPSTNAGRAVIIKRDDTASPVAYSVHSTIQHPSPQTTAQFGGFVTISGDGQTVGIQEDYDRLSTGIAYVWHIFEVNETTSPPSWDLVKTFGEVETVSTSGTAVLDFNGTTFIFGDPATNKMHIAEKTDGVWSVISEFSESATDVTSEFPKHLDLTADGRTLSASHNKADDPAGVSIGSVVIFRKVEQVWVRDQEVYALDNDVVNDGVMGSAATVMNSNGTMILCDRAGYDIGAATSAGGVHCFESKLAK